MKEKATIIPIAAGKGGVGKSLITANLGIALAGMGYETVVVDMDLGGSNLHSFLGLPNRFPGVGDFLRARNAALPELLVSTEFPHLKFLPGDGRMPFLANIPYAQKLRLITHVKGLPARYILLDLGGGTAFNTLDFFRVSFHGFVVVTPEYPSIMSMLAFLKLFLLRTIERHFAGDRRIRDMLGDFYKESMVEAPTNMDTLRSRVSVIDAAAGSKMKTIFEHYRPRVLFNRVERPEEAELAEQIDESLSKMLSLAADYFGVIFEDPKVRESVRRRTPFFSYAPDSMAARGIKRTAERVAKFWDRKIKESAKYVLSHARKIYENPGG